MNAHEEIKAQIKTVRQIIKSKPELKNVTIRAGQGTSYGWVDITGTPYGFSFTPTERAALKKYFDIASGGNFAVISPEDRRKFIAKYG